jgi:hypothetical protein
MENYIEQVKAPDRNFYNECYNYALFWIKNNNKLFSSEDIIDDYNVIAKKLPAEPRVWGAVIRELKKQNIITHAGFGVYKKKSGHKKPTNLWQRKF